GLRQNSIYMQVWREGDGQALRRVTESILLLVWDSRNDLIAGKQPVLIRCHLSTQNPGPASQVRGNNQATALTEKLAAQKRLKKVESERNRKRRELYDAQDSIDVQRDELIGKIEKQLSMKQQCEPLFAMRWMLH
ncbi:MAG: hypothetical protein IH991_18130, partial [Planctomycetes bacterium]|nr:hypothetical protein [Planctomycetota bacterium]